MSLYIPGWMVVTLPVMLAVIPPLLPLTMHWKHDVHGRPSAPGGTRENRQVQRWPGDLLTVRFVNFQGESFLSRQLIEIEILAIIISTIIIWECLIYIYIRINCDIFFNAFKLPKMENARFVDPKWNHDHCGDDPRWPSHHNQQLPLSQRFGIGGDQKTVHQHVGNTSLCKDLFFSIVFCFSVSNWREWMFFATD